jgi:hypothetical protein
MARDRGGKHSRPPNNPSDRLQALVVHAAGGSGRLHRRLLAAERKLALRPPTQPQSWPSPSCSISARTWRPFSGCVGDGQVRHLAWASLPGVWRTFLESVDRRERSRALGLVCTEFVSGGSSIHRFNHPESRRARRWLNVGGDRQHVCRSGIAPLGHDPCGGVRLTKEAE